MPQNIGIVDYIFHAASPISGKDIVSKPIDVITSNLMGVKNCLDYLRLQKKERNVNGKLVVFSSATVYGDVYEVDCNYSEKDTYHAPKLDSLEAYYSETKKNDGDYCQRILCSVWGGYSYSKNKLCIWLY